MKTCNKCNFELPIKAFQRKSSAADGRAVTCAACVNKDARRRYHENSDGSTEVAQDPVFDSPPCSCHSTAGTHRFSAALRCHSPNCGCGGVTITDSDWIYVQDDKSEAKLSSGVVRYAVEQFCAKPVRLNPRAKKQRKAQVDARSNYREGKRSAARFLFHSETNLEMLISGLGLDVEALRDGVRKRLRGIQR